MREVSAEQVGSYPFDLGSYSRPVSTSSGQAQRWFDLGLNWYYGFNLAEAVRCFRLALAHDPACVMAYWGLALSSGPFYNLTWREFGRTEIEDATRAGHDALERARALASGAAEVENRLVDALGRRFQKPHPVSPEEFARWDMDYADAMRALHHDFPDDHDVMALLAEALIMLTPRRLWDNSLRAPAPGSAALEAVGLCERSIALADSSGTAHHPFALHMHIHALEMSHHPDRALRSAFLLGETGPDNGHVHHMPAHIYSLCGDYEKAKRVSRDAERADDMYARYCDGLGERNMFFVATRCHDLHLLAASCMFLGQFGDALAAARKVRGIVTDDLLRSQNHPKFTMFMEAWCSMRLHVLVRFGRWHEIIREPAPDDPSLYVVTTVMTHYAQGIAYAALKDFEKAEASRRLFLESLAQVPESYRVANSPARDTLAVAEAMLDGELAYHKGDHEQAFRHLRESVRRDDALVYTEPAFWMHPPRHALAALLAEQGFYEEAEQVYRDDLGMTSGIRRLSQHPENVWALQGLAECLEHRKADKEHAALEPRLEAALAKADVPITSSCFCRSAPQVADGCCCRAGT